MRNTIIGIVIGIVCGILFGTTVVAPNLKRPDPVVVVPEVAPPVEVSSTSVSESDQRSVLFKVASAFPTAMPHMGDLILRLKDEAARLSTSGLHVELFEPDAPAIDGDLVSALTRGRIDAAFASPAIWSEKSPALDLYAGMPFGPDVAEYLGWMSHGEGQALLDEILARHSMKAIMCGVAPSPGAGWFRSPLNTVNDFQGLNIRTTGIGAKVLARLGANIHNMDVGSALAAMEDGTLDGMSFSIPSVDQRLNIQRFARHYMFPGWQQPTAMLALMINLDSWDNLEPDHQAEIQSLCGASLSQALGLGEGRQFKALMELSAKSVNIKRLPPAVLDALSEAWADVAAEESAANRDFARAWHSLSKFRSDYEIWRELSRP